MGSTFLEYLYLYIVRKGGVQVSQSERTPALLDVAQSILDGLLDLERKQQGGPTALPGMLALLSHYPAKGLPSDEKPFVAMDRGEDLGQFPGWAINRVGRCKQERQLVECLRKLMIASL